MAIQKLKKKSGYSYRVQVMRNGTRISRSFNRKKDAEQFHASLMADSDFADLLTSHAMAEMTLTDACNEYLEQHTGKDTSISQRLRWWCSILGMKKTGQVTKKSVREALKHLKANGLAHSTLNRYKAALSAVYSYLSHEYDTKHNPAREVKQFKEDNKRTRFLTSGEQTRLLQAVKESNWNRLHLLVLMAITTGARRTELLKLRWSDINFQDRRALVEQSKNGEPRVLPLIDEVIEELQKRREVGQGFIFPHSSHQHHYFQHFDKYWQAALKRAGITNFRFHDLRHTAASILANNGVPLLEIGEVLGHKSIQMTQRYAHFCVENKQATIDRVMGGIVSGN
ncbi:Phage integrase family protein [Vibrio nigripulchritudo MADA3029]|uniref:tyrosine-type recombinase/integrase n=1 Tax=Vibrio nigripulchritudo TaxID=28173 RepID=UPI0003B22945|nr:site-specific integrase [Vibrio nigripulchritudo]KJY79938.1 integrase [Vibrio nigripulchritudo]CCN50200.1 Phage integrase family protein [Vibrio nigripulchritudo MADA3020]CCN53244.1 Phage integrase family protein [Vibrio nigripulchritudo MADA3021]CCN59232.1 Phage integrase family protein [Vibrio nigripulchritudo MADA3029]